MPVAVNTARPRALTARPNVRGVHGLYGQESCEMCGYKRDIPVETTLALRTRDERDEKREREKSIEGVIT